MFPVDVQLSGGLFTHQTDLRSTIDEHENFVPVYLSENSWTGPGIPELGVSGVIFQARVGRNMSDSDYVWGGRGPGSNLVVIGN